MKILFVISALIIKTEAEKLEAKSVLRPGWGMLYDYHGQMIHGLNRYNLIIGVHLPKFDKMPTHLPPKLVQYYCRLKDKNNTNLYVTAMKVCEDVVEIYRHMLEKADYYTAKANHIIQRRLPLMLRRLDQNYHFGETEHKNPMKTNLHVRNKRWVNALVNVGVQALSTFLTHVRDNKLKKGITWLKEDNLRQDQEIRAVKEDLLSFAKASIKDLAETRSEVREQGNLLRNAIDELSDLTYKVDHLESTITDINYAIQTLSIGLTNLIFKMERYLDAYQEYIMDLNSVQEDLGTLATGRLPQGLMDKDQLESYLQHVMDQLKDHYPDYELVTSNVEDYYKMPIITSTYLESMITIQIPLLVKLRTQKPLFLYKVKTVPMPYHMNKELMDPTESDKTYTQVIPNSELIALNDDTAINLDFHQLDQCVNLANYYFCERTMLVKHKAQQTCEGAIYHSTSLETIKEVCNIKYYLHLDPKPELLDSGEQLILSNIPLPWIVRCGHKEQIPNSIKGGPYVVINKADLCECSLFAGNPIWKVERNIAHCQSDQTSLKLYYTYNMTVMAYQFLKAAERHKVTANTLIKEPIRIDPKEPNIVKRNETEILNKNDEPVNMKDAMTNIERVKYIDTADYAQSMNNVKTWFYGDNSIFGILFVGFVVTMILVPIIFYTLKRINGLGTFFGKMNSRLAKVVGASTFVEGIRPIEAYTQESVCVEIAPGDMLLIASQVLGVVIFLVILWKLFKFFQKWYEFQTLNCHQVTSTLYNYTFFDKTDLFIQFTTTFGAQIMQVHIGTYFGNPEDITIVGKIPEFEPITLEKHVIFDTLNFEWQTFNLVLRDVALSLPIYKNLYFLRRVIIRSIFKSELGMYRIIAHNATTCKLQVLHDFKKLVTPKPVSNPITIERHMLPDPVYMEMNFDKPRIKTNPNLETELYTKPFKLKYPKNPRTLRTTMMGATADLNEILDECSEILAITDEPNENPGTNGNNDRKAIEEGRYNLQTGEQKIRTLERAKPEHGLD